MITKAIIPMAELGIKMLPETKSIPMEMLPIVDKPLIQYIVNEAVLAGIKEIVLVAHYSKNAVENHFDKSFELESELKKRVKRQQLEEIQSICPPDISIMYVRQGKTRGLAHAISKAKPLVRGEPFAIILPDVLINQFKCDMRTDNLKEMIDRFNETGRNQIMVQPVPLSNISAYGVIDTGKDFRDKFFDGSIFNEKAYQESQEKSIPIENLVEKPAADAAPGNLAIVGRYVVSDKIWDYLENTPPGIGNEIQFTDTLRLMNRDYPMDAVLIKGDSFDCGSQLGYMKAFIEYALRSRRFGADMAEFIRKSGRI
jgi:UTP--glucose-1-phosphate uridylyltransferase